MNFASPPHKLLWPLRIPSGCTHQSPPLDPPGDANKLDRSLLHNEFSYARYAPPDAVGGGGGKGLAAVERVLEVCVWVGAALEQQTNHPQVTFVDSLHAAPHLSAVERARCSQPATPQTIPASHLRARPLVSRGYFVGAQHRARESRCARR